MSHDVFISHSSVDKNIADAVCASLENASIRCWIAPRDIRPGDSWGAAIVKGIERSRVMVVVFSANSNESKQVMREVERAVQKDVVVVPFRIDGVEPSADMEYFLSATHWLDAMTPEMDAHLEKLNETVRSILKKSSPSTKEAPVEKPAPLKAAPVVRQKPKSNQKKLLLMGLGLVAIFALVIWLLPFSESEVAVVVDSPAQGDGNLQIAAPDRAIGAGRIDVTVTGKSGTKDYIVIGKMDAQDRSYLVKADVEGEERVSIEVPDAEGLYEIRYFDGDKRAVVARKSLKVNAPEVTLDAVDKSMAGTEISVKWKAPNNNRDFLAIAEKGSEDSKYVTYAYTAKGSPTSIRVPTVEGNYELRYVSAQSKTAWARRDFEVLPPKASVSVPETAVAGSDVVVEWTGPALRGDFVAVAEPGSEGRKYLNYKYVKKGQKLELLMPIDEGAYEVRYVSGGSYLIRDSATISVTAVSAAIGELGEVEPGEEFTIDWDGPGYRRDYIAIFKPESENNRYLSYRYAKQGDTLRFKAPDEPGNYELRYISGQDRRQWAVQKLVVKAKSGEAEE